jgi:hypothetical protein
MQRGVLADVSGGCALGREDDQRAEKSLNRKERKEKAAKIAEKGEEMPNQTRKYALVDFQFQL